MTSEKQLLKRARKFDQQALAEIYDRYSPGVFRYAVRLLNDSDQAENCVSETFNRFLQALAGSGGPRAYLKAYLFRIAHNWITDQYRQPPPLPLDVDYMADPDPKVNPQSAGYDVILKDQVRSALLTLTPDQRQVIVLKYLEGWSNAEVARSMGKPVGAVKSLQHRALAALRRRLKIVSDDNGIFR
jgi:RNA polymerase sigma-70 factor (ECF subfamily)